ncbi:MAG: Tn3 family transposase [Candidatus Sericytochromatia bacterium]
MNNFIGELIVSTYPKILSNSEIKEFDNPPVFNSEERKKFFNISEFIEEELSDIRTDKNKLVFILLTGYFKCCHKFFVTNKFNSKDINYIINKFNLKIDELNLDKFNRMTFLRYKNLLLTKFALMPFDTEAKKLLVKEAKVVVAKKFRLKSIFQSLLEFLFTKKIEIPSYNAFAEIITEALNEYEKGLQEKILTLLDEPKKYLLDNFLLKIESETAKDPKSYRYKITNLKKFSHSTKPSKIRENTESLKFFKNIFNELQEIIMALNLSPETIEYYATWSLKAESVQLKNNEKKYLHLLSFVVYQYFTLQDLLIDILLSSIRKTSNTARKENADNYYQKKKERETKFLNIAQSVENKIFPTFIEIEKILFSKELEAVEKIDLLMEFWPKTKKKEYEIKAKLDEIKNETKKSLKDNDFYAVLQEKSIKLQNRVSEIIKNLEFDRINSNKKLLEAIDYYRQKNGVIDHNAPDSFIEDYKKKDALIDIDGKFRISLYKVFLFQDISDAVKSGSLNIKHSYRYKTINEYLISKDLWKENKSDLLQRAGLEKFQNFDNTMEKLKKNLEKQYKSTNRNILNKKNEYISFKNDSSYVLTTPKYEKEEMPFVSELFTGQENIPLTEILFDVNNSISFLDSFEHHNLKYAKEKPNNNVFFAGLTGYGCNIGIKRIARISKGINENELGNTLKWYFSLDNLQSANNRILSFINQLDLPNIFKNSKKQNHTSSDGQKYEVHGDSLNANYSYKYFGKGKGVSVYSFIDERHLLFYSTVISSSEREAGYVIDGLMNNEVIKSDIHSTDTHGYSEIIFGLTHLLGFSFAPRIKNFKEKNLYCFDSESKKSFEEKGFKILPDSNKYINIKSIKESWDDVLRFLATIKLKETTASQLLKRLSSYSRRHRLYQALNEFGKIIRTIFMLKYIDDLKLRQTIEKQLNKVESANKFAKAVFFGNNQEFEYVTKEEQDVADASKRLIENAIICWNYLYLSQKVSEAKNQTERNNMLEVIKNGSIVIWKHINLYGEYDFSEKKPGDKSKFDIPKILDLNIA